MLTEKKKKFIESMDRLIDKGIEGYMYDTSVDSTADYHYLAFLKEVIANVIGTYEGKSLWQIHSERVKYLKGIQNEL